MSEYKYRLITSNRKTKDLERAILPTILFAGNRGHVDGVEVRCRAIQIGWWAWGIGVMQTRTKRI